MKSGKSATAVAKEDPEAKARREVDEARAEADKTTALQNILDRRSRKIMRIFGKPTGTGAEGGGNSGSSGVLGSPGGFFSGGTGGDALGVPNIGKFTPDFSRFEALGPGIYY